MNDLLFQSIIEDVMQQSFFYRQRGEQPLRVRISERQWRLARAAPDAFHLRDLRDDEITVAGLPVRVDRDWDAPVTVETKADQKP